MKKVLIVLALSSFLLASCGEKSGVSDSHTDTGNPDTGTAELNENVVVQEETRFMKSVIGTSGGQGKIILDQGQAIPQEWQEGKVVLFPASSAFLQGLSIKITSIEENPTGHVIQYSTPNIDELFLSANIQDTTRIATKQIKAFRAPDSVKMTVTTMPALSALSSTTHTDAGKELEWLPELGKFEGKISGKQDEYVQKISFSLNDVIIVRTKDKQEEVKLSGGMALEDVYIHKQFTLEKNNLGLPDLDTLVSGAQIDFKQTSNLDLTAKLTGLNASLTNVAGLKEKFACASAAGYKKDTEYLKIEITGTEWPKSDLCLGAVSLQLKPVPISFKAGNGGTANIIPSLDLFLIMGMDLKLSVTASWNYKHVTQNKLGAWLNMKSHDKLQIINENLEVSKTNLIQGTLEGSYLNSIGIAFSMNLAGVKPVVARGFLKAELQASASVRYGAGANELFCSEGGVEAGFGYSVHLGVSSEFKTINVPSWAKKEFSAGVSYNYEGETDTFLSKGYDSCKPETLTYNLDNNTNTGVIKIDDISLKSTSGDQQGIQSFQWTIYQAVPFTHIQTLSQNTLQLNNLKNGDYIIALTVIDADNNEVIEYIEVTVSSSPEVRDPVAPSGLTATSGDGKVSLSWTSSESQHRVHYATESFAAVRDSVNYGLLDDYVSVDLTSGTSTVIENLTNGTTYYFVVTALKKDMESDASNEEEIVPTDNQSNSQVAGTYKIFDDGRTDIQEKISFSRQYGDLLFVGTENGKIVALDPQTLTVNSKVVISTDKFQYIDATVDYIYRHNNDLYVSLHVRPSDSYYMAVYKIENETIQNLSRLFKLTLYDSITGMYYHNDYLYIQAGRFLASYYLIPNVPKQIAMENTGAVNGICGIDDSIYLYHSSYHSSQLSKYTIQSGNYSDIRSITSSETGALVCSNSLLLTHQGAIYDKELNLVADDDRYGIWTIEGSTAYFMAYLHNQNKQTCSLSGKSINLSTQEQTEIIVPINSETRSYTNCRSYDVLGRIYYYKNYINHIDLNRHRLSSYSHDLNINQRYDLNGDIQKIAKNSNYVYIGTSNKILQIKDDKSYSIVLDWNNVPDLLSNIASFDVNDHKMLLTTYDVDGNDNVFLFNLLGNGFLKSTSPYVRKYIRPESSTVKGLIHNDYIVLTGVFGNYGNEYLHIYGNFIEKSYFETRMSSSAVSSAVSSGNSIYAFNFFRTNRIYYSSADKQWTLESTDFLRDYRPVYIGNNITTFRYGYDDNFITLDESANEITFIYGNHFPFKKDGELFTFYSNDGAEIKTLASKCMPIGSVINHQSYLWMKSTTGLCVFNP